MLIWLRSRSAFTLVELIIALVIIGVLSGIAWISYRALQERAVVGALTTTARSVDHESVALAASEAYALGNAASADGYILSSLDANLTTAHPGVGPWTAGDVTVSQMEPGVFAFIKQASAGSPCVVYVPDTTTAGAVNSDDAFVAGSLADNGGCVTTATPNAGTPAPVVLAPADWQIIAGQGDIAGDTVHLFNGGNVIMSQPFRSSDMTVSSTVAATGTWGYGFWLRATMNPDNTIASAYSFQVDRAANRTFALYLWKNGQPCFPVVADAPWPAGFSLAGPHQVTMATVGDTFTGTVDGQVVLTVPSLSAAIAASPNASCRTWPVPSGASYGTLVWMDVAATWTGTTVS